MSLLVGKVWTGASSTAWQTAANWFPAIVLGTTDDVTIPSTAIWQPTLSTAQSVRSLTLGRNAVLTVTWPVPAIRSSWAAAARWASRT